MRPTNSHIFCLCLLLMLTYTSRAFEFRTLSWEGNIDGWHYTDAEEVTHSLSLSDSRLSSQSYTHAGEGPVEFFILTQTPEGSSQEVVLSLPPPNGTSRAILMIKRSPNEKPSGVWLDDSLEQIPVGTMKIFNFASSPTMLKLGNKNVPLGPYESHSYTIPQGKRALPLKAAIKDESNQWKLFSTLPLPVQKGSRMIVFIRKVRADEGQVAPPATLFKIYDTPRPSTP